MTNHLSGRDHEKIEAELLKRTAELARTNEELRRNAEKYRELVQNANSIILRMDVGGNITFFNEFAQNFFGYKEEEILGKHVIGTIVPPADTSGQDLKAMIGDIMLNPGKYINNENENMLRSGRRVWVAWTNKPILNQNKQLEEVLCIGNDITRLKQAEAELLKAKELAEAASKAGAVVCDIDWKIKSMNAAARKYLNIDDPSGNDEDFLRVIFKNYSASIPKDEIVDLSKARKAFDLIRPETQENKPLYLQVNMEVLRNQLHEISSIVMMLQDVTDMRREELMKQDFLGLMSHKLSTPLNVIMQDVSVLKNEETTGALNDKQKKFAASILNQSYLLKNLIEKLIHFTVMNNEKLDLSKEEIGLYDYLPMLVNPFTKLVKEKKVDLKIDCPDKSSKINMNRVYFDLIVGNLIENAIKFNDKEAIKIDICVINKPDRTEISVSDNGRGIPPEEQERVFKKFYQLEKNFTGNIEGVGLGLALVKRIVSAYGGQIGLRSEIAKGTSFTITFPR